MTERFATPQSREIAYNKTEGAGPGVVFLGGFMSDKEGTKAIFLEDWAKANGRAFLRMDYSGHGMSSGAFADGSLSTEIVAKARMLPVKRSHKSNRKTNWPRNSCAAVSRLRGGGQWFVTLIGLWSTTSGRLTRHSRVQPQSK